MTNCPIKLNISAVSQAVFCYYEKFAKIIIEKKSVNGSEQRRDALFKINLTDLLAKVI